MKSVVAAQGGEQNSMPTTAMTTSARRDVPVRNTFDSGWNIECRISWWTTANDCVARRDNSWRHRKRGEIVEGIFDIAHDRAVRCTVALRKEQSVIVGKPYLTVFVLPGKHF